MLEFFLDKKYPKISKSDKEYDDGSGLSPYEPISREGIISALMRDALKNISLNSIKKDYPKVYVSSLTNYNPQCKCKWLYKITGLHYIGFHTSKRYDNLYVMCLDCDDEYDMLAALRCLNILGIGYSVIKSSEVSYEKKLTISTSPSGAQNVAYPEVAVQNKDHYWIITDFVGDIMTVTDRMSGIPGVDSRHVDCSSKRETLLLRAYPKWNKIPVFPDSHSLTNKVAIEWYEKFKSYWHSKEMSGIVEAVNLQKALCNGDIKHMVMDPKFVI